MGLNAVAGGAMFSLGSGGFMAAYALALGANNLQVGILAALPPISQIIQLPAILLVERFRHRKAVGLPAWFLAQLMWLPIGAAPFMLDAPGAPAITAVIVFLAIRGLFNPVWVTASTSWMRDLVPQSMLGRYFGRRQAMVTTAVVIVGLAGSFFVQWWQGAVAPENEIYAYSLLIMGGWLLFGLTGPLLLTGVKEPLMPPAPESERSALSIILEPLRDANFRNLARFLLVWNFSLNLAVPFFAIYMLTRLGYSLPLVVGFTILSQIANVLFVRVWGAMADQVGSKAVLSLASSLYLLVIIGWTFTTNPGSHFLTIPLITALHVFAGIAAAGTLLTIQTLGLKLAPEGKATPYLGIAGLATGLGGGIGPIVGGALADYFSTRSFRIDLTWSSPTDVLELPAITLTGFDFLFVIAFFLGLISLNLLTTLREEGEISRAEALGELMRGADPAMRAVSSVPGVGAVSAASYGYIKRVPGADVALGVMAYQLASSAQAAVTSAGRGRRLAQDVQSLVGGALEETIERVEGIGEHSLELARHTTRGAIHAGDNIGEHAAQVAHAAVTGTLRTLARAPEAAREALRGVGYGSVQGALESGNDSAGVAAAAIQAAREVASELGIAEEEAAAVVAQGVLDAAAVAGGEALDTIRDVLPEEIRNLDAGQHPADSG